VECFLDKQDMLNKLLIVNKEIMVHKDNHHKEIMVHKDNHHKEVGDHKVNHHKEIGDHKVNHHKEIGDLDHNKEDGVLDPNKEDGALNIPHNLKENLQKKHLSQLFLLCLLPQKKFRILNLIILKK
jgi:uncharacterized protein YdeI (YjbR/CyaY-like superfamily)